MISVSDQQLSPINHENNHLSPTPTSMSQYNDVLRTNSHTQQNRTSEMTPIASEMTNQPMDTTNIS